MERYTKITKSLENDPNTQIRFHKKMMRVWAINSPIIVTLYLFTFSLPGYREIILGFITFYTAIVSLYANWVSDFDGLSAAQSTLETMKQTKSQPLPEQADATPAHLAHL